MPKPQLLTDTTTDYGDPEISARKRPRTGAALIYPMAPAPTALANDPNPEDVVLAVAWIIPGGLSIGGPVIQFRAKDNARANQPIVPVPV